ncbi:MAG: hemerythrin family protein [Deltaproteobacteria bacterium]|nr:hemerythrin family protein [Deltaproteobacteria bacterium]
MIDEWWKDLATGNVKIDDQHKELFRKINLLLAACEECKGKDEVGNLLRFLNRYVREHFQDEESLQVRHNYPLHKAHKQEHDAFIRDLTNVEELFSREGASLVVIVNTGKMALDWIRNHIYRLDKEMAEFVNNAENGVGNLSDPGTP